MIRASVLLRRVRDGLAVLGLVLAVLAVWVYAEGRGALSDLAGPSREVLARLARDALETDVTEAMVVEVPLAPGVSAEAGLDALERRAGEIGLETVRRATLAGADGAPGDPRVELVELCGDATLARLAAASTHLAVHSPCRVIAWHDGARGALAALDLDLLIYGSGALDERYRAELAELRDKLLDAMAAGGGGE